MKLSKKKEMLKPLILLIGGLFLSLCIQVTFAKEIEVTKEWTKVGENDTIPAGVHVRMDMTTGEKWVKELDDDDDDDDKKHSDTERNGAERSSNDAAAAAVQNVAAVVQGDGTIQVHERTKKDGNNEQGKTYDFEMMHRTLKKLPEEEKQRMGGIPELPASGGLHSLTPKERELFEHRMAQIWERRQKELKELEETLLDLPEVLKERIKLIREYLQDPTTHLREMDLDEQPPPGQVSHIISVLQDLEFQVNDLDNSRDFHTLGGWPLIVSLLSEQVHVSPNATTSLSDEDRLNGKDRLDAKIRAVQANAAWVIGTAVKNTGEFAPYAIEPVQIDAHKRSTAVDMLVEVFTKDYDNYESREVRALLEKSIYALGSLLRGNRMAQTHFCATDGAERLGKMLLKASKRESSPSSFKLTQRLLSLAGDIVSDVTLHGDVGMEQLNLVIIKSFTTKLWCDAPIDMIRSDPYLPIFLQETLLTTIAVLSPFCEWNDHAEEARKGLKKLEQGWNENKDDFDGDHFTLLLQLASAASEALLQTGDKES